MGHDERGSLMTPSAWEYFSNEELACRCGTCKTWFMQADFMEKIVKLRKFYGKPLVVTSAYRCPAHDEGVGSSGTPGSGPHTQGRAMDFAIDGEEARQLLKCAFQLDLFTGFGVNQKGENRFLHFDDIENAPGHPRPFLWTY